jgi:hypothetical protein
MSETEILTPASLRWREFLGSAFIGLSSSGCKHNFSHAKRIMSDMGGVDIAGSLAFFKQYGGYCDVEILLNLMCHFDDLEQGKTPNE